MRYILLVIIMATGGCTSTYYKDGFFAEVTSGKHYDCYDVKTIPDDYTQDQKDFLEYCFSDTMQDFTKNKWGEHRDWKTGMWVR